MTRSISLEIELALWMQEEPFQDWIDKFNIEWTDGVLTEEPDKRVIWLKQYDETLFDAVPEGETLIIRKNFRMFLDGGTKEISITELNYMQYWAQRFDFYKNATGKYNIEMEAVNG